MPRRLRLILPLIGAFVLPTAALHAEPGQTLRTATKSSQTSLARPTRVIGQVPRGYRIAWRDGRLNPQRGPRSLQGNAQMRLIWTDTVPRRLRR
ncbi:MAG: hypothetical protein AAF919_03225 [Pseudomonadota bacterium]